MDLTKIIKILLGPLLCGLCFLLPEFSIEHPNANAGLGVLLWMATWWILEPVPLGVTGLLPLALFPILGIMGTKEIAPVYGDHIIFIFIGGFLIAYGMERWGLHERIALKLINLIGYSATRLTAGFMISSYLLSMWISNTATTVMLIAPAMATLGQLTKLTSNKKEAQHFGIILLLAIAYTASIGGMTTLVGTPPNLIFQSYYEKLNVGPEINFFNWMLFGLPISLTFLVATFLYFRYRTRKLQFEFSPDYFKDRLKALGPMTFEQRVVAIAFTLLALTWMTRKDIDLGGFVIPGWHGLFPENFSIQDSSVALLFAVLLFAFPSKNEKGQTILGIEELKRIPINIMFMFGGGFALAKGFVASGLGQVVADQLGALQGMPNWVVVLIVSGLVLFLTEVSSNSPTVHLILPVLIPLATTLDIHPILLMMPATIAASFAFMLPISTPPNAIIFESGMIPVKTMMRYGFWLNLIGLAIINIAVTGLASLIFGI